MFRVKKIEYYLKTFFFFYSPVFSYIKLYYNITCDFCLIYFSFLDGCLLFLFFFKTKIANTNPNSADGHYELKLNTKAIVHHNGLVAWQPPATYKSACDIDVEYFPLDIQTCFLKLGSWTYAGYQVGDMNRYIHLILIILQSQILLYHFISFFFCYSYISLSISLWLTYVKMSDESLHSPIFILLLLLLFFLVSSSSS